MDRDFLTDEDIHGCEEESEVVILKNKLDKLEQNLEIEKDKIKTIKLKLKHDINVNQRCLEEEIKDVDFKRLLKFYIDFDNELLEILSE